MTELRCLTVRQPWAGLIALGVKPVENRRWKTSYRGLVGVHAGLEADRVALTDPSAFRAMPAVSDPQRALTLSRGVVLAVAELADICSTTTPVGAGAKRCDCGEFARPYQHHWRLTNARPIDPVPARGQLCLWTPEPELAERILAGRVQLVEPAQAEQLTLTGVADG